MMKNHIGLILAVVALVASLAQMHADRLRDTREPSKNADDLLQRFVGELIAIQPGEDPYPESLKLGEKVLEPKPFRIAAYETTQELYRLVTGKNPSRWMGLRNSVESMTVADAREFCQSLTKLLQEKKLLTADKIVRLPTDEEWEYAARAGTTTPFYFGTMTEAPEQVDDHAWYHGNAAGNDPAVGVLQPNDGGLYDVHGYLWELVEIKSESAESVKSSTAMGGSWRDSLERLTFASRLNIEDDTKSDAIGFRCVITAKSP